MEITQRILEPSCNLQTLHRKSGDIPATDGSFAENPGIFLQFTNYKNSEKLQDE
jgi:hypothetical protein